MKFSNQSNTMIYGESNQKYLLFVSNQSETEQDHIKSLDLNKFKTSPPVFINMSMPGSKPIKRIRTDYDQIFNKANLLTLNELDNTL